MVAANELRISNLVSYLGEIITVDGIDDIDVFNSSIGDIPLHMIESIPLTPEWLERMGFDNEVWRSLEIKSEEGSRTVLSINNGIVFLTQYIKGYIPLKALSKLISEMIREGKEIEDDKFGYIPYKSKVCLSYRCNHVHTLQNLYFALTGTELIIK